MIGPDGEQLGVMPIREALRVAEEADLDLVEVAPQSKPPVCRLMDFGRFKYEQSKRDREAPQEAEGVGHQGAAPEPQDRSPRYRSEGEER